MMYSNGPAISTFFSPHVDSFSLSLSLYLSLISRRSTLEVVVVVVVVVAVVANVLVASLFIGHW